MKFVEFKSLPAKEKPAQKYLQLLDLFVSELLKRDPEYRKAFKKSALVEEAAEQVKECWTKKNQEMFGDQFLKKWMRIHMLYLGASLYDAVYQVEFFDRNKRTRVESGENLANSCYREFMGRCFEEVFWDQF